MSLVVRTVLLAVLATLALASSALAVPCGADRCKSFPAAAGAEGAMTRGPDGNLWFVGSGFVGRMSPRGEVAKFPAPTTAASDVEAGPDGGIWFTAPGQVGRMGTDGAITLTRSVGGSAPGAVAPAENGSMLSTAGGFLSGVSADGAVSRLLAPTRSAPSPTARVSATPNAMVRGLDGALWFVQSDPAGIGRIAPDGSITTTPLPQFGRDLAGIAVGPDNGLWFTAPSARMIGRMSPRTGSINSFRTSWNPYAIASGPSHAIWFAMTDRGRWTLTRMVPAGYMSFFQVPGPIHGLAAGPDDAIYVARGVAIDRFETFLGAYPIRRRTLPVSYAGSVSMRLFCPKFDLIFCAGRIVVRHNGRVVGSAPFSQRVNDAPATRIVLTSYGRRIARRSPRVRVMATIVQHDQGGVTRESNHAFYLVRRKK